MAEKIIDSAAFLDMPLSAQCLYFHMIIRADDDYFVENPQKIMKTIKASEDDLNLLKEKRFVFAYKDGAVMIKSRKLHEIISQDESVNEFIQSENQIEENLEEFFNSIWKLYPVKKGKGQVSKNKKKVLQRIGFDEIKRCVDRFLRDMESDGRDRKYWMHGSTFFNSGYVDYLDENYLSEKPKKLISEKSEIEDEEEEILEEIPGGDDWVDYSKMTDEEYEEYIRVHVRGRA